MEMNGMMPSYTRQSKNEEQAKAEGVERQMKKEKKKVEKTHYTNIKGEKIQRTVAVAPVKVYTKKAIKELNRKLKKEGSVSAEDFEEVK